MLGLGVCPCGVSVLGVGQLDSAEATAATVLIQTSDGTPQAARQIAQGQYVYDDEGRIAGMDPVQQLVLLAISTKLNSSAVEGMGMADIPDRIRPGMEKELQSIVDEAVRDLYNQGLIKSLGISVERAGQSAVRVSFLWRDLLGGKERRTVLK